MDPTNTVLFILNCLKRHENLELSHLTSNDVQHKTQENKEPTASLTLENDYGLESSQIYNNSNSENGNNVLRSTYHLTLLHSLGQIRAFFSATPACLSQFLDDLEQVLLTLHLTVLGASHELPMRRQGLASLKRKKMFNREGRQTRMGVVSSVIAKRAITPLNSLAQKEWKALWSCFALLQFSDLCKEQSATATPSDSGDTLLSRKDPTLPMENTCFVGTECDCDTHQDAIPQLVEALSRRLIQSIPVFLRLSDKRFLEYVTRLPCNFDDANATCTSFQSVLCFSTSRATYRYRYTQQQYLNVLYKAGVRLSSRCFICFPLAVTTTETWKILATDTLQKLASWKCYFCNGRDVVNPLLGVELVASLAVIAGYLQASFVIHNEGEEFFFAASSFLEFASQLYAMSEWCISNLPWLRRPLPRPSNDQLSLWICMPTVSLPILGPCSSASFPASQAVPFLIDYNALLDVPWYTYDISFMQKGNGDQTKCCKNDDFDSVIVLIILNVAQAVRLQHSYALLRTVKRASVTPQTSKVSKTASSVFASAALLQHHADRMLLAGRNLIPTADVFFATGVAFLFCETSKKVCLSHLLDLFSRAGLLMLPSLLPKPSALFYWSRMLCCAFLMSGRYTLTDWTITNENDHCQNVSPNYDVVYVGLTRFFFEVLFVAPNGEFLAADFTFRTLWKRFTKFGLLYPPGVAENFAQHVIRVLSTATYPAMLGLESYAVESKTVNNVAFVCIPITEKMLLLWILRLAFYLLQLLFNCLVAETALFSHPENLKQPRLETVSRRVSRLFETLTSIVLKDGSTVKSSLHPGVCLSQSQKNCCVAQLSEAKKCTAAHNAGVLLAIFFCLWNAHSTDITQKVPRPNSSSLTPEAPTTADTLPTGVDSSALENTLVALYTAAESTALHQKDRHEAQSSEAHNHALRHICSVIQGIVTTETDYFELSFTTTQQNTINRRSPGYYANFLLEMVYSTISTARIPFLLSDNRSQYRNVSPPQCLQSLPNFSFCLAQSATPCGTRNSCVSTEPFLQSEAAESIEFVSCILSFLTRPSSFLTAEDTATVFVSHAMLSSNFLPKAEECPRLLDCAGLVSDALWKSYLWLLVWVITRKTLVPQFSADLLGENNVENSAYDSANDKEGQKCFLLRHLRIVDSVRRPFIRLVCWSFGVPFKSLRQRSVLPQATDSLRCADGVAEKHGTFDVENSAADTTANVSALQRWWCIDDTTTYYGRASAFALYLANYIVWYQSVNLSVPYSRPADEALDFLMWTVWVLYQEAAFSIPKRHYQTLLLKNSSIHTEDKRCFSRGIQMAAGIDLNGSVDNSAFCHSFQQNLESCATKACSQPNSFKMWRPWSLKQAATLKKPTNVIVTENVEAPVAQHFARRFFDVFLPCLAPCFVTPQPGPSESKRIYCCQCGQRAASGNILPPLSVVDLMCWIKASTESLLLKKNQTLDAGNFSQKLSAIPWDKPYQNAYAATVQPQRILRNLRRKSKLIFCEGEIEAIGPGLLVSTMSIEMRDVCAMGLLYLRCIPSATGSHNNFSNRRKCFSRLKNSMEQRPLLYLEWLRAKLNEDVTEDEYVIPGLYVCSFCKDTNAKYNFVHGLPAEKSPRTKKSTLSLASPCQILKVICALYRKESRFYGFSRFKQHFEVFRYLWNIPSKQQLTTNVTVFPVLVLSASSAIQNFQIFFFAHRLLRLTAALLRTTSAATESVSRQCSLLLATLYSLFIELPDIMATTFSTVELLIDVLITSCSVVCAPPQQLLAHCVLQAENPKPCFLLTLSSLKVRRGDGSFMMPVKAVVLLILMQWIKRLREDTALFLYKQLMRATTEDIAFAPQLHEKSDPPDAITNLETRLQQQLAFDFVLCLTMLVLDQPFAFSLLPATTNTDALIEGKNSLDQLFIPLFGDTPGALNSKGSNASCIACLTEVLTQQYSVHCVKAAQNVQTRRSWLSSLSYDVQRLVSATGRTNRNSKDRTYHGRQLCVSLPTLKSTETENASTFLTYPICQVLGGIECIAVKSSYVESNFSKKYKSQMSLCKDTQAVRDTTPTPQVNLHKTQSSLWHLFNTVSPAGFLLSAPNGSFLCDSAYDKNSKSAKKSLQADDLSVAVLSSLAALLLACKKKLYSNSPIFQCRSQFTKHSLLNFGFKLEDFTSQLFLNTTTTSFCLIAVSFWCERLLCRYATKSQSSTLRYVALTLLQWNDDYASAYRCSERLTFSDVGFSGVPTGNQSAQRHLSNKYDPFQEYKKLSWTKSQATTDTFFEKADALSLENVFFEHPRCSAILERWQKALLDYAYGSLDGLLICNSNLAVSPWLRNPKLTHLERVHLVPKNSKTENAKVLDVTFPDTMFLDTLPSFYSWILAERVKKDAILRCTTVPSFPLRKYSNVSCSVSVEWQRFLITCAAIHLNGVYWRSLTFSECALGTSPFVTNDIFLLNPDFSTTTHKLAALQKKIVLRTSLPPSSSNADVIHELPDMAWECATWYSILVAYLVESAALSVRLEATSQKRRKQDHTRLASYSLKATSNAHVGQLRYRRRFSKLSSALQTCYSSWTNTRLKLANAKCGGRQVFCAPSQKHDASYAKGCLEEATRCRVTSWNGRYPLKTQPSTASDIEAVRLLTKVRSKSSLTLHSWDAFLFATATLAAFRFFSCDQPFTAGKERSVKNAASMLESAWRNFAADNASDFLACTNIKDTTEVLCRRLHLIKALCATANTMEAIRCAYSKTLAERSMSLVSHSTSPTAELEYIVASSSFARLTLLDLLIRDEVSRCFAWWGYPTHWIQLGPDGVYRCVEQQLGRIALSTLLRYRASASDTSFATEDRASQFYALKTPCLYRSAKMLNAGLHPSCHPLTILLWSSSWSPLALLDKKGARTDGGRTETSCANSPTKKRFSETETDFFQKPFIKLRLAQTNKLTYSGFMKSLIRPSWLFAKQKYRTEPSRQPSSRCCRWWKTKRMKRAVGHKQRIGFWSLRRLVLFGREWQQQSEMRDNCASQRSCCRGRSIKGANQLVQRRGKIPLYLSFPDQKRKLWKNLVSAAWDISPALVSQLLHRYPTRKTLYSCARRIVTRDPYTLLYMLLYLPEEHSRIIDVIAAPYSSWAGTYRYPLPLQTVGHPTWLRKIFACCRSFQQGPLLDNVLNLLRTSYATCFPWIYLPFVPMCTLLPLLHYTHRYNVLLRRLLLRSFEFGHGKTNVQCFMLQFFQALRTDDGSVLQTFLLSLSQACPSITQLLRWSLSTEFQPTTKADGRKVPLSVVDILPVVAYRLSQALQRTLVTISDGLHDWDPAGWDGLPLGTTGTSNDYQSSFFERLLDISGLLVRYPPSERETRLRLELKRLPPPVSLNVVCLPWDPSLRIVQWFPENAKVMQSATKAPFLLQFRVLRTCNRDEHRDAFVTELLHRLDDTSEKETFFRANSACISAKPLCLPTRVTNNDESQQNSKASSFVRSMIFKLNDDVRQDMLAVQLITLCQCIFRRAQLPLYLRPYFVGPYRNCPAKRSFSSCSYTTLEKRQLRGALGGMIEVIPDTMSRHELGVSMECSLSDYFALRFGVGATSDIMNDSKAVCCENAYTLERSEEKPCVRARWEFLRSLAAYSVISFLLQVKDRHNGNLLITREGRLLHIDFGFLFDFSPGRDLHFEKAPFKLTAGQHEQMDVKCAALNILFDAMCEEMVRILGGSVNNSWFRLFQHFVVQGYLALREEAALFLHIVSLMLESGFPCFKQKSLRNFRERFQLGKRPDVAAEYMKKQVLISYNALSTRLYDVVQSIQQGIAR